MVCASLYIQDKRKTSLYIFKPSRYILILWTHIFSPFHSQHQLNNNSNNDSQPKQQQEQKCLTYSLHRQVIDTQTDRNRYDMNTVQQPTIPDSLFHIGFISSSSYNASCSQAIHHTLPIHEQHTLGDNRFTH